MIYDFSLRTVGLAVGLILLLSHLFALFAAERVRPWLADFPRSRAVGIVLCTIAAAWAFWMAATMDLGEFTPNRTMICGAVLAGAILVPLFAEEFLAVRALGILALLAAEPLLDAAFLRPEQSRILLVLLAYLWAVGGLVLVGAPYLLRDLLDWVRAEPWRYPAVAWAGVAYGALLVVVSLLFFAA
ncbi:MAG: hypothetical protein ACOYOL_05535 [Chthoniobacterales bacterium]|jgi:hypothetical protein